MANYFDVKSNPRKAWSSFAVLAVVLIAFPFIAQQFGNSWVRIMDFALLYIMLALGLNIVVGFAGLLDLGYIAFYAVGAYVFALLGSPHLTEQFAAIATLFPAVLYAPWWLTIPFIALAIIVAVLMRPQGLWPAPQRGKSLEK